MRRHHIARIALKPRAELPVAVPEATPAPVGQRREDLGEALDLSQVAAVIGCSPWTVRHGLIPNGLPCFRARANGKLIFYRQQVVRWILRRQHLQGGQPAEDRFNPGPSADLVDRHPTSIARGAQHGIDHPLHLPAFAKVGPWRRSARQS